MALFPQAWSNISEVSFELNEAEYEKCAGQISVTTVNHGCRSL